MSLVGQASYFCGGIAFSALAVALLTKWRGRLGPLLFVAVTVTAIWNFVLMLYAREDSLHPMVVFLTELARDTVWLVFMLSLVVGQDGKTLSGRLRMVTHVLWISVLSAGFLALLVGGQGRLSSIFIFGFFAMSLMGLVVTEQVYRNKLDDQRWSLKFLCLALAGLFVFDLVLYSKGLMFRSLDIDLWNARGLIHVMVAPLIAMSAARSTNRSADLFVSRQMAFYTTSLFGAGIYLLAMAAGGYYLRFWGGEWGTVAQVIFVFGGVLVLLVMFFSGQFRARIKVFLNKHFFRYKYDYREEWLRLTRLLSTGDEFLPLRDRSIMSLANPVESPGGALWLRSEDRTYTLAARWNLQVSDEYATPADSALALFLARRSWVIDMDEYRRNPNFYENLQLPSWLNDLSNAWLVVPLVREDELDGFVVLARSRAPQKLTWEDLDLLKTVGRQVAGYLALERAAKLLAEASQFQAFNRFTAFIMHDLKNLIAQQSLVVKNAARHKNNPEFIEDAISTVDNSVRRMSRLLEQLKQGDAPGMSRRVNLTAICNEVVAQCAPRGARPSVEILDSELVIRASNDRLSAVLGHVVRNAQDAAGGAGVVSIRVFRRDDYAVIEVADNGAGMDDGFIRDRLFRPFESTKGSKGMGIGAYQAREFARSLGGDVEVSSMIGKGTEFRLVFPIAAGEEPAAQQQTGAIT